MESIGEKDNLRPRYLTRDRILTFFDSSMDQLVIAQGRFDGFIIGHETSYLCDATADSLFFDGGVVEWKKTHEWGPVEVIIRFKTGLLNLSLRGETLTANAYASSDEAAKALLNLTKERIPPSDLDENVVRVTLWRHHPQRGPFSENQKIICPSWDEAQDNYADPTRHALDQLFSKNVDSVPAGKLVLWHGEPGTGKTYALRSWARTCRDWMNVNYIVDPDTLFGCNANYMLNLLARVPAKKLNLFVAEDTGELLARDAKEKNGQALSRLLNVCDGLIGQGMRIMFLITTNEELGALHPAITRPGRCCANIGFEAFNECEARKWLQARGVEEGPIPARSTIAELYSIVEKKQIVAEKERVFGFVA